MVIETNLHMGKGIVRGDVFPIRRIVPGIPSGVLVSSAQLTIKSSNSDADGSALVSKSITTADVAGTGQVENAGSSGTAKIRFDMTATNTLALTAEVEYYFDIQIKLDNNDIFTIESGTTSVKEQTTQA